MSLSPLTVRSVVDGRHSSCIFIFLFINDDNCLFVKHAPRLQVGSPYRNKRRLGETHIHTDVELHLDDELRLLRNASHLYFLLVFPMAIHGLCSRAVLGV